jgi:phosphoglycerol transferase MdoB-like AlkP superfamily enzyme
MSSSELTFGKVAQRFFLYVGIAVAALAIVAAAIVLSKGAVGRVSGAWLALAVFTSALFWVTIRQSRAYWRRLGFWLAMTGLLVVSLAGIRRHSARLPPMARDMVRAGRNS